LREGWCCWSRGRRVCWVGRLRAAQGLEENRKADLKAAIGGAGKTDESAFLGACWTWFTLAQVAFMNGIQSHKVRSTFYALQDQVICRYDTMRIVRAIIEAVSTKTLRSSPDHGRPPGSAMLYRSLILRCDGEVKGTASERQRWPLAEMGFACLSHKTRLEHHRYACPQNSRPCNHSQAIEALPIRI
jgi:hypothetical protein